MCNSDETASQGLAWQFLLILAVCVCSLAVHFIAEGLAPVPISPGIGLAAQEGLAHLVAEHCEDNFFFPFQVHPPVKHPAAVLQAALATGAPSFLISPLLPPPNF
jgi:hypothetical protein